MIPFFSDEFSKRIIAAVEFVERLMRSNGERHEYSRADGTFVPVQLTEDLTEDDKATAYVCTPGTSAPYVLTAGSQQVDVWPWKIPSDKKLPSGRQCWAMWWGGKLYSAVIDDCLEDVEE